MALLISCLQEAWTKLLMDFICSVNNVCCNSFNIVHDSSFLIEPRSTQSALRSLISFLRVLRALGGSFLYELSLVCNTLWKARSRSPRCSYPLSPNSARQR